MKRVVCLLVAILLGQVAAAWGAPAACNSDAIAVQVPVLAGTKVVIDPATRLPIRVERPASDVLIISVSDAGTSVQKEFRQGRSITTIRNGSARVVITISGDEIVVSDQAGTRRGSVSRPEGLAVTFGEFGSSGVVRAGRDLLNRLSLQADTLEGNALLLTRALLSTSIGDRTSTVQHQQWARWRAAQPKIVKASVSSELGPGECWDKYAAEAIRIANDYIDCYKSCQWWQLFCQEGCGALYDIRAEMAFMWYFNCNGPFYGE